MQQLVSLLNPSAKVIQTRHSAVDVPGLLSEQEYDEAQFNIMPAWAEELTKGVHSEADEYGISHFTIQTTGHPLHAERWFDFLRTQKVMKGVLRAKGCFWTQAEPNTRVEYSHVGHTSDVVINQLWASRGGRAILASVHI